MATKNEVSILVSARDAASRVVKGAMSAISEATTTAVNATKALITGNKQLEQSTQSLGRAQQTTAASMKSTVTAGQQAAAAQTQLHRSFEQISADIKAANLDWRAGKLPIAEYGAAVKKAEADLKALGRSGLNPRDLKAQQAALKDVAAAHANVSKAAGGTAGGVGGAIAAGSVAAVATLGASIKSLIDRLREMGEAARRGFKEFTVGPPVKGSVGDIAAQLTKAEAAARKAAQANRDNAGSNQQSTIAAQANAAAQRNLTQINNSLTRALAAVSDDLKRASTDYKAGVITAREYALAVKIAQAEVSQLGRSSASLKPDQLKAYQAALTQIASSSDEVTTSQTGIRKAFRDLANEIPFLNRGLALASAFFTSLPGILAAAAAAVALVAIKALQSADRVQQALVVMRNQLPGVTKDMSELRRVIAQTASDDPFGRTQEEIAAIGRVLTKNGTPSVEAFASRLKLVVQAANASGEAAEGLAEGIDLISDAFQIEGQELEETFAKIVLAANGLVPLNELFQTLGRGSTQLQAIGVDAETAARAIASFADAGIPAREAGTALIRVLDQIKDIGNPTSDTLKDNAAAAKALGIELSQDHVRQVGLVGILREIQTQSSGSIDALEQMGFTAKEATAIIRGDFTEGTLSGADALNKLKEQSDGAGESAARAAAKIKQELDAELVKLGNVLLPPVVSLLKQLAAILSGDGVGDALRRELTDLGRVLDLFLTQGRSGPSSPFGEGPFGTMLKQLGLLNDGLEKGINNWDKLNKLQTHETPSRIRDEEFDPTAELEKGDETPQQRAARIAKEAKEQRTRQEAAQKLLQQELDLITTRIQLGRDEAKDRERLTEIERSINAELARGGLSIERQLELEQTLGKIVELRRGAIATEIAAIQQRAELGKSLPADAARLEAIITETKNALQDQTLSLTKQLALYQQLVAAATALSKIEAPSPGKNLGSLLDPSRQGATTGEEQAARDAANRPGGILSGTEGRGPSDLTEQRAKAAEEAIERAKQRTDEFNQALTDAIAGPLANFFQEMVKGFDDIGDAAEAALNAIADAIINLASQHLADELVGGLFGEPKDPLLEGPEGAAALSRASAPKPAVGDDSVDVAATTATVTAGQIALQGALPVQIDGAQLGSDQLDKAGVELGQASDAVDAAATTLGKGGLSVGAAAGLFGAAAIAIGGLAKGKVGGLLGGIAGFVLGGPAGATLGAGLGSQLGFKDGGVAFFDGVVTGPGGPKDDKIPAWLSNGEGILTTETTQAMGGASAIKRLNKLGRKAPKFADGGVVGLASQIMTHEASATYLKQLVTHEHLLRVPKFADGGVAGAAREPGRAEVTLNLPPGVTGESKSDSDIVKIVIANRRILRDVLSDN
jgi:hypothetical protein